MVAFALFAVLKRLRPSHCSEQILKGLQDHLVTHRFYYYRTRSKSEIDLILEGRFGTIPIEIKASYSTPKNQLRTLEDFVVRNQFPYGVLINNGDDIYKLSENIIQVPANYLTITRKLRKISAMWMF